MPWTTWPRKPQSADRWLKSVAKKPVRFIKLDKKEGVRFTLTNVRFIKLPPRPAPKPRAPQQEEEFVEFTAVTQPTRELPPPLEQPWEQRFRVTIIIRPDYKGRQERRGDDAPPEASIEVVGTLDEIELIRGIGIGYLGDFYKKLMVVGEADDMRPVDDKTSRIIDVEVYMSGRRHDDESDSLHERISVPFRGR